MVKLAHLVTTYLVKQVAKSRDDFTFNVIDGPVLVGGGLAWQVQLSDYFTGVNEHYGAGENESQAVVDHSAEDGLVDFDDRVSDDL